MKCVSASVCVCVRPCVRVSYSDCSMVNEANTARVLNDISRTLTFSVGDQLHHAGYAALRCSLSLKEKYLTALSNGNDQQVMMKDDLDWRRIETLIILNK